MTSEITNFKTVYIHTIKLLTRQDYSRHKLKQKLMNKDYCESVVEEVLEKVISEGFLREDYYTEARVKSLMYKNYSKNYIQQKLETEKVDISLQIISDIFEEYSYSEEEQVESLINKKLSFKTIKSDEDELKLKAKTMNFLSSKGHDFYLCESLLEDALYKLKNS